MSQPQPYAIIRTGGKQYRVKQGDVIDIERVGAVAGESVEFSDVLFASNGKEHKVGSPLIEGCKVVGQLLGEVRGEKVLAYKYKRRTNYRRKMGHRQTHARIQIQAIEGV